jgi:putative methyltransferase (TIGR04325 family)
MKARSLVTGLLPPLVTNRMRRWSGRTLRFSGHPANWAEATRISSGYGDVRILERVLCATRAVMSGEGQYERDSVLLDQPEYRFAVLAGLLRAGAGHGVLDVIDFGGSLGSSYRQCHPFLKGLKSIRWWVVEQAPLVAAGQAEFTTDELRFVRSLGEVPRAKGEQVILASSVLQYLEDPEAKLHAFADTYAAHLIIDRTPLSTEAEDRLCIQHVPKHIYPGSYPCWIFSYPRLVALLSRDWQVICDFPCSEGTARTDDGLSFEFRGLILERR